MPHQRPADSARCIDGDKILHRPADAIRHLHPTERIYTFWHYWRGSFERDAGIRIDHALLSPSLASRLKAAGVDRIVVNTSYMAPQIEAYFRDGHRFGVEMAYSFEGTIGDDGKVDTRRFLNRFVDALTMPLGQLGPLDND